MIIRSYLPFLMLTALLSFVRAAVSYPATAQVGTSLGRR